MNVDGSRHLKASWVMLEPYARVLVKPAGALVQVTLNVKAPQGYTAPFNLCYSTTATGVGIPIKDAVGTNIEVNVTLVANVERSVTLSGLVQPTSTNNWWVGACADLPNDLYVYSGLGSIIAQ
ncbi:MAG: hypothetical protein U1F43_29205 [Myxococcota bacterium]